MSFTTQPQSRHLPQQLCPHRCPLRWLLHLFLARIRYCHSHVQVIVRSLRHFRQVRVVVQSPTRPHQCPLQRLPHLFPTRIHHRQSPSLNHLLPRHQQRWCHPYRMCKSFDLLVIFSKCKSTDPSKQHIVPDIKHTKFHSDSHVNYIPMLILFFSF